MIQQSELRQRIEKYLDETHVTLWLDWDITKPDRRELAVEFVIRLCDDLGLVEDEEVTRSAEVEQSSDQERAGSTGSDSFGKPPPGLRRMRRMQILREALHKTDNPSDA